MTGIAIANALNTLDLLRALGRMQFDEVHLKRERANWLRFFTWRKRNRVVAQRNGFSQRAFLKNHVASAESRTGLVRG